MNARERFHAVMSFESVDRGLRWEFGYWCGALRRWYREGLPPKVGVPAFLGDGQGVLGEGAAFDPTDPTRPLARDPHEYFGMDEGMGKIAVLNYFAPPIPETVLEDHGDWQLWRDDMGIIRRDRKDRTSLPEYVNWPVASRGDWERLKAERLRPTLDGRLPARWPELLSEYRGRTYPLAIAGRHGFYGTPRYLLGDERILTMFYDDPALMHEIIDSLAEFWISLYNQVLSQTSADLALIWEDMCYKAGPLISPAMFREFMLPAYKRLTGCFRDHGIKHILLDTDGDCWQLIPLFLEGGVTGLYPFEVNAGMDIREVRRAFPRLQILGGLDKVQLAAGRAQIDAELEKVSGLLRQGGYVPYVDHLVPPDVSWANFEYYRTRLNQIVRDTPIGG